MKEREKDGLSSLSFYFHHSRSVTTANSFIALTHLLTDLNKKSRKFTFFYIFIHTYIYVIIIMCLYFVFLIYIHMQIIFQFDLKNIFIII